MNCFKITYVAFGREMVRYTFSRKDLVEKALLAICPTINNLVFHPCDVYSLVPGSDVKIPLSSELKYVTTKRGRFISIRKRKGLVKQIQSKSILWSRGFELFEDEFLRVYADIDEQELRDVAMDIVKDLSAGASHTNQMVLDL